MRSNIRAGQSNIVAGSQAMQEVTAQFRGKVTALRKEGVLWGMKRRKI